MTLCLDGCSRLLWSCFSCFFQAEDDIRDLVRSRGLGDVYKRQQHIGIGALHGRIDLSAQDLLATATGRDEADAKLLSLIHI